MAAPVVNFQSKLFAVPLRLPLMTTWYVVFAVSGASV